MERWISKVISLVLIFFSMFIFTLIPMKVKDWIIQRGQCGLKVMSALMCFGGGTFLGVYALHMAPETRGILGDAWLDPAGFQYPVTDLIICLGFMMMLFLETAVVRWSRNKAAIEHDKEEARHHQIGGVIPKAVSLNELTPPTKNHQHKSQNGVSSTQFATTALPVNNATLMPNQSDKLSLVNNSTATHGVTVEPEELEKLYPVPQVEVNGGLRQEDMPLVLPMEGSDPLTHQHHEAGGGHADIDLKGARSFVLLLALSLHHVFEGMSVGLKHTEMAVWTLTIAIVAHECIVSFSLGLQIINAISSRRKIILAAFICAIMTPVGITVGMVIMETGFYSESITMEIVNGVLQAISTGVFLYVTFFEILHHELGHGDAELFKLFAVLIGFLTMALLMMIPQKNPPAPPPPQNVTMIGNMTCLCSTLIP